VKRLHKVNDGLKKFAHVNKKAFEQYSNFTKQRDELLKRRGELEASAESIQELIETLDQRKDEAIERTFKQVSKYFEEVFETLVPAGRGLLVMQKRANGYAVCLMKKRAKVGADDLQDEETEESAGANREKSEIDNYTGVSIKVSSARMHFATLLMQYLGLLQLERRRGAEDPAAFWRAEVRGSSGNW